jgi:hypothetical protein
LFVASVAPERTLVVAPPCQSEIKLTLKPGLGLVKERMPTPVSHTAAASFRADGERQVSGILRLWFPNGARTGILRTGIKGKFTENQIGGFFRKFSAI